MDASLVRKAYCSEKGAAMTIPERTVTVCDKCLKASCWYDKFPCDENKSAGLTQKTVSELAELGREHPSYWTPEAVEKYTGVKQ